MRKRMAALLLPALGLAGCGDGGTAASRSAGLDRATVTQVVDASYGPRRPGTVVVNAWKKVDIAPPRALAPGDAPAAAIPPGTEIVPVEVTYSRTETTGSGQSARDVHQSYLFYKDGSGNWAAATTAKAANGNQAPD
jgi:hypothetical protein